MKFKNFIDKVNKINEVSLLTMRYGTQFGVGVCIAGILIYLMNKHLYIFNYMGEQYSIQIMTSGISLFVQFMIAGIVMDIVQKRRG